MDFISRKDAAAIGMSSYFTGKPCTNGHIAERRVYDWKCRECERERYRAWRKKNKDYDKKRYQSSESIREKKKKMAMRYYEENKDKVNNRKRAYHAENLDKFRPMRREYLRVWRSKSSYKAIAFIRGSLRRLREHKKYTRSEKIIGYRRSELVSRIESQFDKGMSWDNYGEWHIDHIKPISLFLSEGIDDPKVINALSNLQPLWALDNLSKGKNYVV